MERFSFVSRVPSGLREELEKLLYFNPQQDKVISEISKVIAGYGLPEIEEQDSYLRIAIQELPGLQCLFALDNQPRDPRLAGLVLYFRKDVPTLIVLHLAVRQRYSSEGVHATERLVSQLVGKVVEVGRRLRGVESLTFSYREGLSLPLRNGGGTKPPED